MAKALVVVESPAKAKTINKYLGKDYKVVASMGHIRDLPKSKLGVDVEGGFEAAYDTIPTRKKVLKELRDAAKGAKAIYVATDPDREGEAIGSDVAAELDNGKRPIHRLMFNEITRTAILASMEHPGTINVRMVEAQRARRVLDRLVGYKISPLLWDKVRRGLSAGRVQSVALRLVCDREDAIDAFASEEYWHIFASLAASTPPEFVAKLAKKGRDAITIENREQAEAVRTELTGVPFVVQTVVTKERKKHAPAPFITSKLQQASRFPVKKTMMLAQQLYEGIDLPGEGGVGLITYMRTDSSRVSDQAIADVREHIASAYGESYVPPKPNQYKSKASAQDAHEAIRPTSLQYDPERVKAHLTKDQYSLYRLIWNRFVASQMLPARFDDTTVDIGAKDYVFRVKGSVPKFSGWLEVYTRSGGDTETMGSAARPDAGSAEQDDDGSTATLPPMAAGDRLEVRTIDAEQKFTQPPPRFSEATLVKELEENGIGRPSTYASILGTLQDRDYARKIEGRFKPTPLGRLVTELLVRSFDDILDPEYTAKMEARLDEIGDGTADYAGTLGAFYEKFQADLERAQVEMQNIKVEGKPTDKICDKCGSPMVVKVGQFGAFLACSAYPECKNTRELEEPDAAIDDVEEECENCGKPMIVKRGRFGQFLACTGYPDCKTTRKLITTKEGLAAAKPDQVLDERCPQCDSNLVVKHGRFGEFTACTSYPTCKYVKLKSTGVPCPKDGGDIVERKSRRGRVFYGCHKYPECDFTLWNRPLVETCPDCGAAFLVEKVTKRHGRQVLCNSDDCDYVRSEELAPA